MYDAAREVRFRGVSGSVVTRREGSNNLATASLAAAARPCKRFGAVLQASSLRLRKDCTRQKCMRSSRTIRLFISSSASFA